MKKEDFYKTFWDVSERTEEQKTKWQQKCFELGFTWSGSGVGINHLYANTYFLEKTDRISYSANYFRTGDCPIEKHYENMFPNQLEEKLDVVAAIVELVKEAQNIEEEDSFDGLVYVAPEKGQPDSKYFAILRRNCTEDQWGYILENCPIDSDGVFGNCKSLQICSDAPEWFDNDEVDSDDIIVSFNDIFKYKKED